MRIHVGEPVIGCPPPLTPGRPTGALRATLQAGIDACIADFPLKPAPGAWWMPAELGGGAPTEEERQRLDEAEGRGARGPAR